MSDEPALSDALFARLSALLFQKTGITLKDYKKYLVVSRLARFVGPDKDYSTFEALYQALTVDGDGELTQGFINALTTNFSYFFRDAVHFTVLEQYLRDRAPKQDYLRLWSAASSTGEEAYTMAITLARYAGPLPSDRRILATDISTKVLAVAEKGVYGAESAERNLDRLTRATYFDAIESNKIRVKDSIRRMVDFRQLNLQGNYPFTKLMDVIFLRNVMIYFAQEEKAQIIERMHDHLKPGGLLFIGLSESLAGIPHHFRTFRNSTFQKVRP
ncbi:MAG: protein-glutamate O-methyltransferase CheR [Spirochaetales bacterium]